MAGESVLNSSTYCIFLTFQLFLLQLVHIPIPHDCSILCFSRFVT